MARSIWNGTITLGRIPVAVKVFSAVEDHTIHFHQVHSADGERLTQRRICSKNGREVAYSQIVHGYQRSNGDWVVLTKDEIAAAAGDRAHIIELEQFVAEGEIDPVFFERTYHLGARDEDAGDAYRLLHDALVKSGRVGLGRWVFHNREYLVAIRARDDLLVLHTMRFAHELIDPDTLAPDAARRAPTKREIEMAGKLVDSLHDAFDPDDFADGYRDRVRELIAAKARGETPEIEPETPRGDDGTDLVAALEASLSGPGR